MPSATASSFAAWRIRAPVWIGMAAIVALCWIYLARMNAGMSAMPAMAMPSSTGFGALVMTFLMWAAMMAAMMLPTAIPSVSVFMSLATRRGRPAAAAATAMYVAGYGAAWVAFCLPIAVAQWGLTRAALLTPMGQSTSVTISAVILVAAGLFQFTPLKNACVSKCRAPFAFFMAEWRDGRSGAFLVGLRHGGYCVGCCWALMAVMFVVGAMNLLWMGLLALLVLGEKTIPERWRFERIVGALLIACGAAVATGIL